MQERARAGADISISAVTYAELRSGAERSQHVERYSRAIRLFCERLSGVLAWDRAAADEFAALEAELTEARETDRAERHHDRRPRPESSPGSGHQQPKTLRPRSGTGAGELVRLTDVPEPSVSWVANRIGSALDGRPAFAGRSRVEPGGSGGGGISAGNGLGYRVGAARMEAGSGRVYGVAAGPEKTCREGGARA